MGIHVVHGISKNNVCVCVYGKYLHTGIYMYIYIKSMYKSAAFRGSRIVNVSVINYMG